MIDNLYITSYNKILNIYISRYKIYDEFENENEISHRSSDQSKEKFVYIILFVYKNLINSSSYILSNQIFYFKITVYSILKWRWECLIHSWAWEKSTNHIRARTTLSGKARLEWLPQCRIQLNHGVCFDTERGLFHPLPLLHKVFGAV